MRNAIYQLKRTFGTPARVRSVERSVNRQTGDVASEITEVEISHLIILPVRHSWSSALNTPITRVNAAYQQGDREFLLDVDDFHSSYTMKHVIVINGVTYSTVAFEVYPECIYIIGRNEHS